ncbi:hypothetical protein LCI18_013865 [Fusarium solani-melongenae]|uniref:Uncharacterized protein n=1 Tax=Fusarium solani subsp. cucurbitae TaxID=2747967 RepID=A0ACD3ZNX0_FUSSC|nr:hypothetical protein LCI18_013865 [Fusarium solani-melongenae]
MTNIIRRRKAHRKSREGCAQCKERHAKCNEVHPQCLQCERANIPCSFSSPTLTMTPLNEDSLADLELLEHWHRYPVTGDMTETTRHLQYDLVRLGFSHHYLLNSILGLTALQLYSEDQSQSKWYARAVAHQQAAISRARPHFESLDQTQHSALLGFSAFTSMYAVAEPLFRPPRVRSLARFDLIEELLKALHFSRSTLMFVQQNFPPLVVSESWLLTKFVANHQATRQDLEIRYPQLVSLRECIERRYAGRQKAACLHAVEVLFGRIATLSDNLGDPEPGKVIWAWGLEVYQTFLDLCSARDPVALVILAHFTVLMSFYKEHWCLRDWPGGLLRYIIEVLGGEWEDALKWPSDFVFGMVTLAP